MSGPWSTCTADDCTGARLPGRYLCIAHADAVTRREALAHVFTGERADLRGVRLDPGLLDDVLDALPTDELGRKCWRDLQLDGATIEVGAELDLSEHVFTEGMTLRGLLCLRPLLLCGARLDAVDWRDATFDAYVDASGARFAMVTRLDDATFHGGLSIATCRFGAGIELRRVAATFVRAERAAVSGSVDLSLSAVGTLDLSDALLTGDLVLDSAEIDQALLTGISIDGSVRDAGATVRQWLPSFTDAAADTDAVIAREHAVLDIPWRPDLLAGPADEYWWLAIEEWVGDQEDEHGRRPGGVIGLQVAGWPALDELGKPVFDDNVEVIGVLADALADVLDDMLGTERHALRVGNVYAARLTGSTEQSGPLDADALRAVGLSDIVEVTKQAREAAQAAHWSVHVPALDSHRDARLINALIDVAGEDSS